MNNISTLYPKLIKYCAIHYFDKEILISLGDDRRNNVDPMVVEVLKLCDGRHMVCEIVNMLCKKYEVQDDNRHQVSEIIHQFVEAMKKNETLELVETSSQSTIPIKWSGQKGKTFPYLAIMELTDSCNFFCSHCYKDAKVSQNHHMPIEIFKCVLDKLRGHTPIINLTGGEPSIHPCINEMLDYCDGFDTVMLTNGSNINKIESYRLKKIASFQVSMYGGSADTYNTTTGNGTHFDKFLCGLDIIKASDIHVRVAIVLNKPVIGELDECIKILVDKKINEVTFGTSIIEGRRVGEVSDSVWEVSKDDIEKADEVIEHLKSRYRNLIRFVNPYKLSAKVKWRKDPKNYELTCMGGRYTVTFSNKGVVKACNYVPDGPFDMGNYEDYLRNIENGKVASFSQNMMMFEHALKASGRSFDDFQCKGMCGEMIIEDKS